MFSQSMKHIEQSIAPENSSRADIKEVRQIDETLYSRQLYVLGYDAMSKLLSSSVLVIGLDGLGTEICKNLVLAGISNLYLFDNNTVNQSDLSSGYYFTKSDIGRQRCTVVLPILSSLNPTVNISIVNNIVYNSMTYSCIITCNYMYYDMTNINRLCHDNNICYIGCTTAGLYTLVYCDMIDIIIYDKTGEPVKIGIINDIDDMGVVTTVDKDRHDLEDGDVIKITENKHYNDLYQIEVLSPYQFRLINMSNSDIDKGINITSGRSYGGYYEQQRKSARFLFKSLDTILYSSDISKFIISYDNNISKSVIIHYCFITLSDYIRQYNMYPRLNNKEDSDLFINIFYNKYKHIITENSTIDVNIVDSMIRTFSKQCDILIMPVVSVVGGIVAQEVLKAVSCKFTPLCQFMYYDCIDLLVNNTNLNKTTDNTTTINTDQTIIFDNNKDLVDNVDFLNSGRFNKLIELFGINNMNSIFNSNIFMVGCGAIGCEHIKNLIMIGCGKRGIISITDNDSVEQSNLNRQFLFRRSTVGKMKSDAVKESANGIEPSNVDSYCLKVGGDTESVFSNTFIQRQSIILNALDNIEARYYMDDRAVFNEISLIDAGTLGTKGNVQVVVPFVTESYSSSMDPPEKNIPLCTIRNFPNMIEHCIEYGLNAFNTLFTMESDRIPSNKKECIIKAVSLYYEYFIDGINQLIDTFPSDHITKEGLPFWTAPKRPPVPLVLDINDNSSTGMMCRLFIISCSNLYCDYIGNDKIDNDDLDEIVNESINIINNNKKRENNNIINNNKKRDNVNEEIVISNRNQLDKNFKGKHRKLLVFEKDDDNNNHINFIYAVSNLRADNYKIKNASRHTVKGIAGKIIPAIATTTAVVSGLSIIESMKVLFNNKNKDIEKYSNSFVNLALPYIANSTPLAPERKKYALIEKDEEKFEDININCGVLIDYDNIDIYFKTSGYFTEWDKIKMKDMTMISVLKCFKKIGLEAQVILVDGRIVYMDGDEAYNKNMDKMISELSTATEYISLDIAFDSECAVYPTIVIVRDK